MKKITLCIALFIGFISFDASAQDHSKMNPNQVAELKVKELVQTLQLDNEQVKAVREILIITEERLARAQDNEEKIHHIKEDQRRRFRVILSDEQYEKYYRKEDSKKEKRGSE